MEAEHKEWRAPTQAGFRKSCCRKDLIIAVDYLIDRASSNKWPLVLCYADLKKAFDTVPRYRIMIVLAEHYGLNKNIVKAMQ